ncbi:hypothetical protein [Streptomyces lavendulae]|uniref:hypothetical protein n=1 Tax=Streptomyces lavendulae TaxID=1914 RepID=UPI0031EDCA88
MTLKKKAATLAASVGLIMSLGTGLASAEEGGHGGHGDHTPPLSITQFNYCGNTHASPLSIALTVNVLAFTNCENRLG